MFDPKHFTAAAIPNKKGRYKFWSEVKHIPCGATDYVELEGTSVEDISWTFCRTCPNCKQIGGVGQWDSLPIQKYFEFNR